MSEIPDNESVEHLRRLLHNADAINPTDVHSFKKLMGDPADVPDQWYWHLFDELEAKDHLDLRVSRKLNGGDAQGRLSREGRRFVQPDSE